MRRLKAPDGRRWLGRVLDPGQVPQLKVALGLTDTASAFGDGAATAPLVLQEGASLALAGGLWLRRAKVMDRYRIEVVGAASQRAVFTSLGCFVEIIAYTPRVFVPTDQPEVLTAVLAKWPVQTVLPRRRPDPYPFRVRRPGRRAGAIRRRLSEQGPRALASIGCLTTPHGQDAPRAELGCHPPSRTFVR